MELEIFGLKTSELEFLSGWQPPLVALRGWWFEVRDPWAVRGSVLSPELLVRLRCLALVCPSSLRRVLLPKAPAL